MLQGSLATHYPSLPHLIVTFHPYYKETGCLQLSKSNIHVCISLMRHHLEQLPQRVATQSEVRSKPVTMVWDNLYIHTLVHVHRIVYTVTCLLQDLSWQKSAISLLHLGVSDGGHKTHVTCRKRQRAVTCIIHLDKNVYTHPRGTSQALHVCLPKLCFR